MLKFVKQTSRFRERRDPYQVGSGKTTWGMCEMISSGRNMSKEMRSGRRET